MWLEECGWMDEGMDVGFPKIILHLLLVREGEERLGCLVHRPYVLGWDAVVLSLIHKSLTHTYSI
jgi:hypothetical protein